MLVQCYGLLSSHSSSPLFCGFHVHLIFLFVRGSTFILFSVPFDALLRVSSRTPFLYQGSLVSSGRASGAFWIWRLTTLSLACSVIPFFLLYSFSQKVLAVQTSGPFPLLREFLRLHA